MRPNIVGSTVRPGRSWTTVLVAAAALSLFSCGDPDPAAEEPTLPEPDGAVSAGTREATEAGLEILRRGGNAADAAVAVSFALGVTEPAQSGLGGTGVALVTVPGADPVLVYAGVEPGPEVEPVAAAGASERPQEDAGTGAPVTEVVVPTALRVLEHLFRTYGSGRLEWSEVVEPAVQLAEDGYPLGRYGHRVLAQEYGRLIQDSTAARQVLTASGALPAEGSTRTNPDLANTLRRIGRAGAADFYEGDLATRLLEAARMSGVELDQAALAGAPAARERNALEGRFRDATVWVPPAPFAGPAVLRALGFLESAPDAVWEGGGAIRAPWIAEALVYAFGASGTGDPSTHVEGLPPLPVPAAGGETTHFSLADGAGMTVSMTQSLGRPFGAGVPAGDLGFFWGARPDERSANPPGGTAGGAPAAASVTSEGPADVSRWAAPIRIVRGDSLELVLGSPGGPRGVSAVVQVMLDWMTGSLELGELVSRPRLHVGPDGSARGRVYLEGMLWEPADSVMRRVPPVWGDTLPVILAGRGLVPTERDTGLSFDGVSPWFGGVNAVARFGDEWSAAADPRRDGEGRVVGETRPQEITRPEGPAAPLPPPPGFERPPGN